MGLFVLLRHQLQNKTLVLSLPKGPPQNEGVPTLLRVGGHLLAFVPVLWAQSASSGSTKENFYHSPLLSSCSKICRFTGHLVLTSVTRSGCTSFSGERCQCFFFFANRVTVPKKTNTGCICSILDLQSLHIFVFVLKFHMESARSVIAFLRQGGFLISIDKKTNAYSIYTSQSFASDQGFPLFAIGDQHFQFVTPVFRLSSATQVFTSCLPHFCSAVDQGH